MLSYHEGAKWGCCLRSECGDEVVGQSRIILVANTDNFVEHVREHVAV